LFADQNGCNKENEGALELILKKQTYGIITISWGRYRKTTGRKEAVGKTLESEFME